MLIAAAIIAHHWKQPQPGATCLPVIDKHQQKGLLLLQINRQPLRWPAKKIFVLRNGDPESTSGGGLRASILGHLTVQSNGIADFDGDNKSGVLDASSRESRLTVRLRTLTMKVAIISHLRIKRKRNCFRLQFGIVRYADAIICLHWMKQFG